jgi:murein DD-endopeptidase MepM/ murein hydrolase activator NlpD
MGEVKASSHVAPFQSPLGPQQAFMTQDYYGPTHAAQGAAWGGIDVIVAGIPALSVDAPLYAVHAGTVAAHHDTWPGGNCVIVQGDEWMTKYCHLSHIKVEDGQQVRPGDVLGLMGSTGMSTGVHLHFELWRNGVNVNPLDYMSIYGVN